MAEKSCPSAYSLMGGTREYTTSARISCCVFAHLQPFSPGLHSAHHTMLVSSCTASMMSRVPSTLSTTKPTNVCVVNRLARFAASTAVERQPFGLDECVRGQQGGALLLGAAPASGAASPCRAPVPMLANLKRVCVLGSEGLSLLTAAIRLANITSVLAGLFSLFNSAAGGNLASLQGLTFASVVGVHTASCSLADSCSVLKCTGLKASALNSTTVLDV
mmetsp:Transcript_27386/g.63912  ORF Transcript_27386/g.63912 Transcript_27386/m.63912 type:complete len:219 (-) Transcript_27386:489-1145(-)